MEHETCAQCGFDSLEWNDQDTVRTIGAAHRLVEYWIEGLDEAGYNRRSSDEVWSVGEYVNHIRETLFGLRVLGEAAIADPGVDLGPTIDPAPAGDQREFERADNCSALEIEAGTFGLRLGGLDDDEWNAAAVLGGDSHDVRWASRHAVHDLWHHLIDIANIRADLGDVVLPQAGSVAQINVSQGGVPKIRVDNAGVGRRGVEGDVQTARLHHGRPWQAVCLWSADVIDALVSDGHPVFAGACGENITISGLDWNQIRSGAVIEIGEVVIRVSAPAEPCTKNAAWFIDGEIALMNHDLNPGWSRWYGLVEQTGHVSESDAVTIR